MSNNSVIIPNDRVMIILPLGVGVPYLCTQKLKKELLVSAKSHKYRPYVSTI